MLAVARLPEPAISVELEAVLDEARERFQVGLKRVVERGEAHGVEIATAELDPRYMRGYGPVSEEGATDLHRMVAELQSAAKALHRYILQPA